MKYADRLNQVNVVDVNVDLAKADLICRTSEINRDIICLISKSEQAKNSKNIDFKALYSIQCEIDLKKRELLFLEELHKELF